MIQVVWFKRDLRIMDHEPLFQAAARGPVLPLYILEPELWSQPDMSRRQYLFLTDCLHSLNSSLKKLGQELVVQQGDVIEVLSQLHQAYGIDTLWSHQETWNNWTYQRDLRVAAWVKQQSFSWQQPPQFGVIRCLKNRDGWAAKWYTHMNHHLIPPPKALKSLDSSQFSLPTPESLGLMDDGCPRPQSGGRDEALLLLQGFLNHRGKHYTKGMSSPVTAYECCSRLSPHFAFGTVSVREVFQVAQEQSQILKQSNIEHKSLWSSAIRSFLGRLRWHCHFIQKLEDQPNIEYQSMHPGYQKLRGDHFNEDYYQAWCCGLTGYPMIDACMRALIKTGWLNFRMRAMLVSFASYHLWLDWPRFASYLARLFVDYEPGIHYSQIQMQSGTTGMNSIRIYNPVKQSLDQDPEGLFIKKWVPELAHLSKPMIHTPWLSPDKPISYPDPIVDETTARKQAASKLYALRRAPHHKIATDIIIKKHASRKRPQSKRSNRPSPPKQSELPF
ncbi:MAG: deoxyribodipyrimidine photo-lyase [Pseudomonadota bacterium]|nr:deoxyribodipyrimidine photo-lyase [Pseudomonadota bacterium]